MSIINVNIGQGGNQLGQALITGISSDLSTVDNAQYNTEVINKWFNVLKNGKREARTVYVDTELRTVPSSCRTAVARCLGGSSNNWALGYFIKSKCLINETMDLIRLQAERSDLVSQLLIIFGTAGGTGSGVGSLIIEKLRDEFPSKLIFSCPIFPYQGGDVCTQSFNTLFTLSKVKHMCDAILPLQNDKLHYICSNSLGIKDITFDNINNLAAFQLCSVFQPIPDRRLADYIAYMCCMKSLNFVQSRYAPQSPQDNYQNWNYIVNTLSKPERFYAGQQARTVCLSQCVLCRGSKELNEKEKSSIASCEPFVTWLPKTERQQVLYQPQKLCEVEHTVSVLYNSNSIVTPLNVIWEDAWSLFQYKMFVHHYTRFGLEEMDFLDSFAQIENTMDAYKQLH